MIVALIGLFIVGSLIVFAVLDDEGATWTQILSMVVLWPVMLIGVFATLGFLILRDKLRGAA